MIYLLKLQSGIELCLSIKYEMFLPVSRDRLVRRDTRTIHLVKIDNREADNRKFDEAQKNETQGGHSLTACSNALTSPVPSDYAPCAKIGFQTV